MGRNRFPLPNRWLHSDILTASVSNESINKYSNDSFIYRYLIFTTLYIANYTAQYILSASNT